MRGVFRFVLDVLFVRAFALLYVYMPIYVFVFWVFGKFMFDVLFLCVCACS